MYLFDKNGRYNCLILPLESAISSADLYADPAKIGM